MNSRIKKMIAEGEHQTQDFKYCISDSRKIARSLAAFANTDGGTLLIGIRDNGTVAGVESEEEFYMIENAFLLFCRPEIPYRIDQHILEGKTVVEIIVDQGENKPYYAKGVDNKWWVYIRKGDQNLLASPVILKLWKRSRQPAGTLVRFGRHEEILMHLLQKNERITLRQFRKAARISKHRAENILVSFIRFQLVDYEAGEKEFTYYLTDNYQDQLDEM